MEKYTKEQKLEVAKFFEEGFSAREIFEVTNIPVGTLYRWKHEAKTSDPKAEQVEDNRGQEDNRDQLQARVAQLEAELAEISIWVSRKKKSEAKEREQSGSTSTFQFKRA